MRALAFALLLAAPASALEWTPIAGFQALGAVNGFSGQNGGLTGELDGVFAPAMSLSPRWSLLPSIHSSYSGVRRLNDVLGAATVSQQRMEHRLAVRGVWADPASRWRFKPGASFKWSMLNETRDESWGRGLFDERRWTIGGEAELLTRDPHSLRLGVDWYEAAYPNYTTLESQAALQSNGQPIARELVGDRALDRRGVRLALSADAPVGARAIAEGGLSTVLSSYPRQRVVADDGQFAGRDRLDLLTSVSAALRMPHDWNADLRALAAFEGGVSVLSSNQNGYDATRGRFLPRFYDYTELKLSPSARLLIGPERRPVTVGLGLGWRRRTYPHRPPQEGTGAYGGGALAVTEWSATASVNYPMAPRLSLVFQLERASAASNQRFERFYRYAYESASAMAGVRWEWR